MTKYITPEDMREWEQSLTKEQINYAMELAIKNGWSNASPPMWVWAQFFREAEEKFPKPKEAANDNMKSNYNN